jgi:hypothetical protein
VRTPALSGSSAASRGYAGLIHKEKGMAYSVELSRKIYDDDCGACIQVGPDSDGQLAKLLGKALIDAAADAGA